MTDRLDKPGNLDKPTVLRKLPSHLTELHNDLLVKRVELARLGEEMESTYTRAQSLRTRFEHMRDAVESDERELQSNITKFLKESL